MRLGCLLLGVGVLAAAGCYDSAVPLDAAPKRPIDPALVGAWRCLESNPDRDAEAITFVVGQARERVYAISAEERREEPGRYEAYASWIKDKPLLNVRHLQAKPGEKPWVFIRYTFLLSDVLQLEMLSDTLLKDVEGSPSSLRAALERLHDNPELYLKYCVCLRAKEDAEKPAPNPGAD